MRHEGAIDDCLGYDPRILSKNNPEGAHHVCSNEAGVLLPMTRSQKLTGVAHEPDRAAEVRGQPRGGLVALVLTHALPLPHLRLHQLAARRRAIPDQWNLRSQTKSTITCWDAADVWPECCGVTAFLLC